MRARSIVTAGILLGAPGSWLQAPQVPRFEVDPLWPKPLPNRWLLGSATGVAVDGRGHVFVVHLTDSFHRRNEIGLATDPPTGECCAPAPNVLELDAAGNLVGHWSPTAGVWPEKNAGIAVDGSGNVWIGGAGAADTRILKLTRDGKLIAQFDGFGGVAGFSFDAGANEAYVADGYRSQRVAVIDMTTGAVKRQWRAHGAKPFSSVRCAELSRDGFVYVCDSRNNRIQVFRKDGTFVREGRVAPQTLGEGSVWDIAFSSDPRQRYVYVADGMNMKVRVLERQTLRELTSFGDGGRQPGQFYAVHSIATDAQGNLYTVETYEGKRVQKFIYKGLGEPTRSAVPWPGGSR
jgi:DNA-binding beta-propeller fold protein YncE